MDALESFEEIAEQASFCINAGTRQRPPKKPGICKWGHAIAPNLTRAKVMREKKIRPQPRPEQISVAVEIAKPTAEAAHADHVTCYNELIEGIKARVGELGIRQVDFDKLAGFADGLTGKVFGFSQVKRLGPEKLFDAIRAAGLKLRLEADPEQLEKMRKQIAENCQPRQANQVRLGNSANLSNKFIDSVLDCLTNKKGGIARLNKAVKQARSNHARRTFAIGVNWAQKRSLQHISEETLPVSRAHLRVVQGKRRGSKYG